MLAEVFFVCPNPGAADHFFKWGNLERGAIMEAPRTIFEMGAPRTTRNLLKRGAIMEILKFHVAGEMWSKNGNS